jgi:hypothetical protein
MTRLRAVTGRAVLEALLEAGIIHADDRVRRVVIDLQISGAAIMYVERFGDERLLSLVQTLDGIEIRREDKEMGPHPQHEKRIIPAQETRGGDKVDWANAVPGEPLPELPPEVNPETDNGQLSLFNVGGHPRDPHATGALEDDE